MKPPEKALSNKQYRKMKRVGLEKLIEVEKKGADCQSVLRWTTVGAGDTRQTRAAAAEKMRTTREKGASNKSCKNK